MPAGRTPGFARPSWRKVGDPSPVYASAEQYWAAQAALKLGVSPKNLFGRFIDFDDGSRLRTISSGSTPALTPPALDGSWHQYSAGDDVSAGAFGFAAANVFSSTAPKQVANIKTSPWFSVGRWKTITVPGATARSVIGLGISGEIRAGIVKASHATKFCAVWTGTVLASAVPFDTNTHEVVCRNDGTNIYLSVDGEAEVSAAVGALSVSSAELFFEVAAGAGEARQTFRIDYMGLWTGRGS